MTVLFTLLMTAVILVNGWTDAPNAIATCVSTRSLSPRAALLMAGLCNFVGAVGMACFNTSVASSVYYMVNFGTDADAFGALCAGLCAAVLWAVLAWRFGIPTSESHALLSGISGAAVAKQMSLGALNATQWKSVLIGLFLSTLPAFLLSGILHALLRHICRSYDRRRMMRTFRRAQIWSAASNALLHGAQDSQKFMGVLFLGLSLSSGEGFQENFGVSIGLSLFCAVIMTAGTMLCGGRIIKKVGVDMVRIDALGGTAADMASSVMLSLCTICGIPVSTTHTKTCAMMGICGNRRHNLNIKVAAQILLAWLLTFPACGILGFLFAFWIHT